MLRACIVLQNHMSAVMGGAQYQAHLLAAELARLDGVEVIYLTRGMCPQRCAQMQLGYEVRPIFRPRDLRPRSAFRDAAGLYRALEQLEPDVVYQQMRDSYTGVCARYAGRAGIPFFFHIASDADLEPRWLRLRRSTRLLSELIEARNGKRGLVQASHVIAQTARQSEVFRERFGRPATVVVRNFQPLPARLPEKPPGTVKIFWVANLKSVKRPELFVELAESFLDRNDIEFWIAGRAPTMRRLAPLMSRIPGIRNLSYLGELSLEAVNERMAAADIHVNTSQYEGFPNTFIQAWAQGAVVVSVGVDPDAAMNQLGIGFCTRDPAELRDVIARLAGDRALRTEVAHRAFEFAHAHHSMDKATQLAKLLAQEARRRHA